MVTYAGIEARAVWALLFSGNNVLGQPAADYGELLERMEAQELLQLMGMVQKRLSAIGAATAGEWGPGDLPEGAQPPVELFIDKHFNIRTDSPKGPKLPLRPMALTLFILFLRHPEGIVLKQRDLYQKELEQIYSVVSPNTDREDVHARIGRLVSLEGNAFSENASLLNARLDELLPPEISGEYKIQGYNGKPRRIALDPILVHWA